jgi:hypothetical protein
MFKCKRCGYTCENKCLLKRHLSRKNACLISEDLSSDLLENLSIDILLKELNTCDLKKFKCKHCEKTFTDSSNRYRHQKNCKKSDIEQLKETVQTLQQEIINLKENSNKNNITNIEQATIHNHNNLNITLNNFGNESYNHISEEFIKKCIINNVSGVKSLIEKIHFSDEVPENKNVRIKSTKNNLVEIANNNKWVVKDTNEALESMINKGHRILNKYYYNPESGLLDQDINELDARIQNFLLSIIDKNNKHYFALRRRILALLIDHNNIADSLTS